MATFSDDELAMIAVALDDEEPQHKKRRFWVHEAWKKRRMEGEFFTLYKELHNDYMFWDYFRMSEECFNCILQNVKPVIQKQDTQFRTAVTPKERLAVCLRYVQLKFKCVYSE